MEKIQKILPMILAYLTSHYKEWLFIIIIFFAGVIIIMVINRSLAKFFGKTRFDRTLEVFIQKAVNVVLWIILFVVILGNLGLDVTGFIAGLSIMGFIIGFATKDALSNLTAGIILLINRPFKIKEEVIIAGIQGTVKEMNISSCIIITADKQYVTIPNSKIYGGPIKNLSRLKKK